MKKINKDEQKGYDITQGAMMCIGKYAAITFGLILLLKFAGCGMDSSDTSRMTRSGLRVHRDNKTGLEYLSDGKGGLIRRMPETRIKE